MTRYEQIKLLLIGLFMTGALVALFNFSNNGRYAFEGNPFLILDTRTGEVYYRSGAKNLKKSIQEHKSLATYQGESEFEETGE